MTQQRRSPQKMKDDINAALELGIKIPVRADGVIRFVDRVLTCQQLRLVTKHFGDTAFVNISLDELAAIHALIDEYTK